MKLHRFNNLIIKTMAKQFESKFSDGKDITNYQAVGYAEGFEEASDELDVVRAWAYLIKTGMCWSLQGFFGRTANQLIQNGYIDKNGIINWNRIESEN
jgi:hypothetical protein